MFFIETSTDIVIVTNLSLRTIWLTLYGCAGNIRHNNQSIVPSSCDHCGRLFFKNASIPSCESGNFKFRSIISSPHLNERQDDNIILIQRMYTDKDKTIILSVYKMFVYIHKDNIYWN